MLKRWRPMSFLCFRKGSGLGNTGMTMLQGYFYNWEALSGIVRKRGRHQNRTIIGTCGVLFWFPSGRIPQAGGMTMARDDMFSWLNDMKNSRKSPKSPPSGPESTNQDRRENKAVPPPATKEDELELQPTIAAVGNARELTQESVTETISQWVGSILGNPQEPDKQMVAHDLPSPPVNPRPAHEIATEISQIGRASCRERV